MTHQFEDDRNKTDQALDRAGLFRNVQGTVTGFVTTATIHISEIPNYAGRTIVGGLNVFGYGVDIAQYHNAGYGYVTSVTLASIQFGTTVLADALIGGVVVAATPVVGPAAEYGGIAVGAAANYAIGNAFHSTFHGNPILSTSYNLHWNEPYIRGLAAAQTSTWQQGITKLNLQYAYTATALAQKQIDALVDYIGFNTPREMMSLQDWAGFQSPPSWQHRPSISDLNPYSQVDPATGPTTRTGHTGPNTGYATPKESMRPGDWTGFGSPAASSPASPSYRSSEIASMDRYGAMRQAAEARDQRNANAARADAKSRLSLDARDERNANAAKADAQSRHSLEARDQRNANAARADAKSRLSLDARDERNANAARADAKSRLSLDARDERAQNIAKAERLEALSPDARDERSRANAAVAAHPAVRAAPNPVVARPAIAVPVARPLYPALPAIGPVPAQRPAQNLAEAFGIDGHNNAMNRAAATVGRVVEAAFGLVGRIISAVTGNRRVGHDNYGSGGGHTGGHNPASDHGIRSSERSSEHKSTWGNKPVLLDLSGNGLTVDTLSSASHFVDLDGDGYLHRTAWAGRVRGQAS